jgi:hypothetical protein
MVEAIQVAPWWSDSQIWANIATVVTGITAIVMVVFSWVQLRAAREEKRLWNGTRQTVHGQSRVLRRK